jgi:hypothetical protein
MTLNTLLSNASYTLNSWWCLPDSVQEQVKKLVPDKDTWTLNVSKDKTGVWVFSLPQFMTFNESFCNGTELVFDHWYEKVTGKQPVTGSKMVVSVSKVMPTDFNTKLLWLYEDPLSTQSNFYLDKGSGMDVWLCPYLQVLFKEVPEHLWVTFKGTK